MFAELKLSHQKARLRLQERYNNTIVIFFIFPCVIRYSSVKTGEHIFTNFNIYRARIMLARYNYAIVLQTFAPASLCLSVCLPACLLQVGVLSKRINIASLELKQCRTLRPRSQRYWWNSSQSAKCRRVMLTHHLSDERTATNTNTQVIAETGQLLSAFISPLCFDGKVQGAEVCTLYCYGV